jgi:SAM-dependent methyltransferase
MATLVPKPAYNDIGAGYATQRLADPRLAAPLRAALAHAVRVVNIGAGTGSYEPADRLVIAVEPSGVMIRQRPPHAAPVVQASAEALPFPDHAFDVAMTVLSVHHWSNRKAGLAEMCRVAPRRIVLTFDPAVHDRMWLMDYVPELRELHSVRAPTIDEVADQIDGRSVSVVPVPSDCRDGMTIAYWRRPEAYLDPDIRQGGSALRQVDPEALLEGLVRLERDLRSGVWNDRYGQLLALKELDCGLRLVVGEAS